MQKQRAFTVIELLFCLAVLMILIPIGSQGYQHVLSQQALVSSAERLYHFLRLANSQSIKLNKKVYVHFCQLSASNQWDMALSEEGSCDCYSENSCLLNGRATISELSDGKSVLTSVDDITFNGLQASYSPMRFSVNAGSILLSDNNGYKLKVIQSTMRLRICAPDTSQLGYKRC